MGHLEPNLGHTALPIPPSVKPIGAIAAKPTPRVETKSKLLRKRVCCKTCNGVSCIGRSRRRCSPRAAPAPKARSAASPIGTARGTPPPSSGGTGVAVGVAVTRAPAPSSGDAVAVGGA